MKFYEELDKALEHLSSGGAFLTVRSADGKANTMTISWGYVGFSWGKPHFITMVRPQRYTHDLLESADSYTISIPCGEGMKQALAICGTKSGRDVDKEALAGIRFQPGRQVASPVVAGCDIYYECKISYIDPLETGKLAAVFGEACYKGDRHDFYYGEIVTAYRGEKG